MAIATVYCAPAAPMRVAVTLPADGSWRRAGLMGVADASWQDVRRARAIAGRMVELNIFVGVDDGLGEAWMEETVN